jgi:hypothetical protein
MEDVEGKIMVSPPWTTRLGSWLSRVGRPLTMLHKMSPRTP